MKWKIPLFKTYSDQEDIRAVSKVLKRGTFWAVGPEIIKFENELAKYAGTKYALSFNSGTSALHTLLLAHNLKDGEVIVPSFTFVATASAVLLAGGKTVFAESELDTYGLDAKDVSNRINKNTKAIIQLHYGGFPSRDTQKLRELADKNGLILIEDAAESLGSTLDGKKVGSFGHSAIFSFCQNKIISTGEGGAIATNSQEVYEKAKLLRSHGRVEQAQDYFSNIGSNDYIEPGFNFRMPTMSAALGLAQLKKINKNIKKRTELANFFTRELGKIQGIIPPKKPKGGKSVFQMYSFQLKDPEQRNALQAYLANKGIMNKVYFSPLHLMTIFTKIGYKKGDLPITEALSDRILNIPLYPTMTRKEASYIITHIYQFFEAVKYEKSK